MIIFPTMEINSRKVKETMETIKDLMNRICNTYDDLTSKVNMEAHESNAEYVKDILMDHKRNSDALASTRTQVNKILARVEEDMDQFDRVMRG